MEEVLQPNQETALSPEMLNAIKYKNEFYAKLFTDFIESGREEKGESFKAYLEELFSHADEADASIILKLIEMLETKSPFDILINAATDYRVVNKTAEFLNIIKRDSNKFILENKDAIRDSQQLDLLAAAVIDSNSTSEMSKLFQRYVCASAIDSLREVLKDEPKSDAYINLEHAIAKSEDIEKDIVTREYIEEFGEQSLLPSAIPREGGIITLPVLVSKDGSMHARTTVTKKPGKMESERFQIDFGGMKAPEGIVGLVSLSFRLASKKDGVLKLENPDYAFAEPGTVTQPIAYDRGFGYLLPDGRLFAISQYDAPKIDTATGFSKTPDGLSMNRFPTVIIEKVTKDSMAETRSVYYGKVLSHDEYRYQQQYEAVFEQYYQRTKRTSADKEEAFVRFALVHPKKTRDEVAHEIRERSQENPIDIVVSSNHRSMKLGFDVLQTKLDKLIITDENRALVEEFTTLFNKAKECVTMFNKQTDVATRVQTEAFFARPDAWDPYVEFFRRLDSDEIKTLLGGTDIRGSLFTSDLDGEMSVMLFNQAGIRTRVTPFIPDTNRFKPYLESAIHVDISHGRSRQIETNAASGPWNGVSVFLDEDDHHVFSAAQATYDHLRLMGLFESEKVANYLTRFIDDHDGYRGIYSTLKGCQDIFENEYKNIYGIGTILVASGRNAAVAEFFKQYVPQMEDAVIKRNPHAAKNPDVLRDIVLRELIKFDVRPFFRQYIGDDIDVLSKDLAEKIESSKATISALEKDGFVSDRPPFGKILWDPFNAVEHEGLGAFAAGYDCYIGYNGRNRTCKINLAPFPGQGGLLRQLPPDLLNFDDDGSQVGSIIKDGRYLVMNSSARRIPNLGFVVEKIIGRSNAGPGLKRFIAEEVTDDKKGTRLSQRAYRFVVPESTINRLNNRNNTLLSRVISAIPEGLRPHLTIEDEPATPEPEPAPEPIAASPVVHEPASEPEPKSEPIPEPVAEPVVVEPIADPVIEPEPSFEPVSQEFLLAQAEFNVQIEAIQINPEERFTDAARDMRRRAAAAIEKMAAAAIVHHTKEAVELLTVARDAIIEEWDESVKKFDEVALGLLNYEFENDDVKARFYRQVYEAFKKDIGLDSYEAIIENLTKNQVHDTENK